MNWTDCALKLTVISSTEPAVICGQTSLGRICQFLGTALLLLVLAGFSGEAQGAAASTRPAQPSTSSSSLPSSSAHKKVDLSFERVFAKPIYKKNYFPVVILGASIIVAGTVSFFTAGAGAPAAATGVSTVASVVGGGGAGSYMAGLSTIGGWFGGNAMLGAAILNGISLGTVGGGTAWTAMSATQKVGVMTSIMATALDGTLIFLPEGGKELTYRVRLTVPQGLGSVHVKKLAKQLEEAERKVHKAALKEDAHALEEALLEQQYLIERSRLRAAHFLTIYRHPHDLIVLAVIRKNAGDSDQFDQLIAKARLSTLTNAGYLDYLEAVSLIEQGQLDGAEQLLRRSWYANPYAIEPPILLVNLLGHRGFQSAERQILMIVSDANQKFDNDDYETQYSPLALNYRLATFYFVAGRYAEATDYFEKAYDSLPWYSRYVGDSEIANIIMIDLANCLYAQGEIGSGDRLYLQAINSAKTEREKEFLRSKYSKHADEY